MALLVSLSSDFSHTPPSSVVPPHLFLFTSYCVPSDQASSVRYTFSSCYIHSIFLRLLPGNTAPHQLSLLFFHRFSMRSPSTNAKASQVGMTSFLLLASTLFFFPLAHASLLDSVVDQAANATSELSRRIFGNVQGKNLLGGADYPGNDNKETSGQYWYDSATPIDQCPDTTGDINQANRLWGKLNSIVYTGKNFANNGNLPDVTQFVCFNVDAWRLNQGNGGGQKNVNDNTMKATADHMGLKIAARYGAFNRVLLIPRRASLLLQKIAVSFV